MKRGMSRGLLGATAVTVVCLLGGAGAQTPTPGKVPMVEDHFKTVTLLKGIPVDTFFEAMGMFASSMGEDCTFCHVPKAYFDKSQFATPTDRIQRDRETPVVGLPK